MCIWRASSRNPKSVGPSEPWAFCTNSLLCLVSFFLAFCAITMLALFLNQKLNKQTLCFLMPIFELFWKAQILFLWISLLPIFSQVLPWGNGWVEKTSMFAFAERILGHPEAKRVPQDLNGPVFEFRKNLEGTITSFSLLPCVWSLAVDQMRAFPPAEQVISSLCSSYLFWLKHTLKGSRTEGLTVYKWWRMGSPTLLCWLFFLFWISLEILQQRKIFSVKILRRFRVSSSGNPASWWWAALHSIFNCIWAKNNWIENRFLYDLSQEQHS